jgi:hypothetical protein
MTGSFICRGLSGSSSNTDRAIGPFRRESLATRDLAFLAPRNLGHAPRLECEPASQAHSPHAGPLPSRQTVDTGRFYLHLRGAVTRVARRAKHVQLEMRWCRPSHRARRSYWNGKAAGPMNDTTCGKPPEPIICSKSLGAACRTTHWRVADSRFTGSGSSATPLAPSMAISAMRCAPDEPPTPPRWMGSTAYCVA